MAKAKINAITATDSFKLPQGFIYQIHNTATGFYHRLLKVGVVTTDGWRGYTQFASVQLGSKHYVVATDYYANSPEFPFPARTLVVMEAMKEGQ